MPGVVQKRPGWGCDAAAHRLRPDPLVHAGLRLQRVASFWETIYVLPGWEHNRALIRHELCHLDQIRREGRLRFAVGYLWELLLHGYWNNKYEIAARAAERNP